MRRPAAATPPSGETTAFGGRLQYDPVAWVAQHDIVHREPASEWIDGLPLGNGDIGAMVFGDPRRLRIGLSKADVWDNRYAPIEHPRNNYEELARIVRERDEAAYKELAAAYDAVYAFPYPSFQPVGELELLTRAPGDVTAFEHRLSLAGAFSTMKSAIGELHQKFTLFAHATHSVLALHIASETCGLCERTLRLRRVSTEGFDPPVFDADDEGAWMEIVFPDGLRTVVYLLLDGVEASPSIRDGGLSVSLAPKPMGACVLYAAFATSNDGLDPLSFARAVAAGARDRGYRGLRDEHIGWWADYWAKSFIHVPARLAENLWYFEIYKLGSCSRPGRQMPGLQGLWCDEDRPAWHGDYHFDLNVQMTYWPAYSSNHPEAAMPLLLSCMAMLPRIEEETSAFYGWGGAKWPCATYRGGGDMGGWIAVSRWAGSSAWIGHHFWWHELYTRNRAARRDFVYPLLRACVDFYDGLLERDEAGVYHVFPTTSPEQDDNRLSAWGRDSAIDLAFLRVLYRAILDVSVRMKADEDRRERWQEVLDGLAPFPRADGHLIDLGGREWANSHRHMSALSAIYPAGLLGMGGGDPESMALARASLQNVLDRGSAGYTGFSFPWLAAIAAHAGDGETAVRMLGEYIEAYVNVNGFSMIFDWKETGKGMAGRKLLQIEAGGGYAAAVIEMLMQSSGGVIRVFGGLPKAWKDVAFGTLRAEGAFLVSAECRDGVVPYVLIESTAGEPCIMVVPWKDAPAHVRDLTTGDVVVEPSDRRALVFPTSRGHVYVIERPDLPLEAVELRDLEPAPLPDPPLGLGGALSPT